MEQKVFKLPTHPIRGEQKIVIERPSPESVWYLVLEKDKAIPLVNLEVSKKTTPKDILDVAGKQQGEGWMYWFCGEHGYSKL